MADGPYRQVEVVDIRSPRGITFFGNDEGLNIEVTRTLPVLLTGGALATIGGSALFADAWLTVLPTGIAIANAAYWVFPRFRRAWRWTTIDIRTGTATVAQRGFVREDRVSIPFANLGPPSIETIVVPRSRLSDVRLNCLQFDHYVDGVPGGASLPVQILAGYSIVNLEWLRKHIVRWMSTFAASRRIAGG